MTDTDALHLYATRADPAAFAHLLAAHADLVYAAALRQVTDPGLAADVTQAVFILLSRRAPRIRPEHLAGWLVRAAHFASKDALKRRRRRQRHEEHAMSLRPELTAPQPAAAPDWSDLKPHLDAALARLRPADRTAIALRYIENHSLAEVAAAMHITQPAAAKRVQRALIRLRKRLARHLPAATALTLAPLLAHHASAAAPPSLLTAPPSALAAAIAKNTARLLKLAKLKAATFTTLAAATITTATLLFAQSAPATIPADLTARGTLIDESGKPLPNAPYTLYQSENALQSPLSSGRTDAAGTFPIPPAPESADIRRVILFDLPGHALAWATLRSPEEIALRGSPPLRITLQPAATIAGAVTDSSGKPLPNATVKLEAENHDYSDLTIDAEVHQPITTDAAGRFHFERFPTDARCHVTISAPGFAPFDTRLNYQGRFPPVAPDTTDVDASLAPGATLIAQITRAGKPADLPNFPITAWPGPGMIVQHALSDAHGQARFYLAPGDYHATVELQPGHPGILPSPGFSLTAGQTLQVSLDAGAAPRTVSGTLLANGDPLPDEPVVATLTGDSPIEIAAATTDTAGHFSLTLPPGKYTLVTLGYKNGRPQQLSTPIDLSTADIANLTLTPAMDAPWRGQLVDENGNPLQGTFRRSTTTVHTDPTGHFTIPAGPADRGSQPVAACSDDGSHALGLLLDPTSPLPEKLTLPHAASLSGKVLDPNGNPAPDVPVDLFVRVRTQPMDVWQGTGTRWTTRTAADGSYHLDAIPIGWNVCLNIPGPTTQMLATAQIGTLQPGEQYPVPDIRLALPTIFDSATHRELPLLSGNATINGRILDPSGKPLTGIAVSYGLRTNEWDTATSDLKGRFQLDHLPESPIQITGRLGSDTTTWTLNPDASPFTLTWNPHPPPPASPPAARHPHHPPLSRKPPDPQIPPALPLPAAQLLPPKFVSIRAHLWTRPPPPSSAIMTHPSQPPTEPP